jgi:serine/threonine protein kinase
MSNSLDNTNRQSWPSLPSDKPGSDCERTTDGQVSSSSVSGPGSSASSRSLVGTSFGDYELLEEAARGGMGVVYKARQVSLQRVVALKMILEGQLASEDSVRRFYQEARSAAALDHPNIVPIYEIGQCDGRHFFTMAFIEGRTLTSRVRTQGVPSPAEAAALMLGIADAVAYAHRQGVIHRDLKPDNVLLDQEGRPRVTDFGLAKSMSSEAGLTSAGQIMGTPAYMAPEQAWGKVHLMGPATDVYALGGILYFLLTGRPPFDGESTMEVLTQVTDRRPTPPREWNPNVTADLEAICLQCLEKDPANRYSSAGDLVSALRVCCGLTPTPLAVGPFSSPSVHPQQTTPVGHDTPRAVGPFSTPSELIPTFFDVPASLLSLPDTMIAPAAAPPPAPPAPPRRRRGVLAALVVLAVALVGGGTFLAKHFLQSTGQDSRPQTVQPAMFVEPTCHDFEIKVEMIGAVPGENGVPQLMAGRPVKFRIQVRRDAYVGLWNIAPDGKIVQFFPNKDDQNNFVRAGEERVVPNEKYTIDAELSDGMERIWAMASTKPWDVIVGEEEGPFAVVAEQQQKLETTLRGLRLKSKTENAPSVSETAMHYKVVPAKPSGGR